MTVSGITNAGTFGRSDDRCSVPSANPKQVPNNTSSNERVQEHYHVGPLQPKRVVRAVHVAEAGYSTRNVEKDLGSGRYAAECVW